jgi:hypothetical protein
MIEIPPDVQRKHEQPASTQESATVESIHRAVVACGQLCNQLMDLEVLAIDGGELVVASFGDGIGLPRSTPADSMRRGTPRAKREIGASRMCSRQHELRWARGASMMRAMACEQA